MPRYSTVLAKSRFHTSRIVLEGIWKRGFIREDCALEFHRYAEQLLCGLLDQRARARRDYTPGRKPGGTGRPRK